MEAGWLESVSHPACCAACPGAGYDANWIIILTSGLNRINPLHNNALLRMNP